LGGITIAFDQKKNAQEILALEADVNRIEVNLKNTEQQFKSQEGNY